MNMQFPYQAFYCEENIWHLAQVKHSAQIKTQVLFISNPQQSVELWLQKASGNPQEAVIWDYHVILLCQEQGKYMVYDFDSFLAFPVQASTYTIIKSILRYQTT